MTEEFSRLIKILSSRPENNKNIITELEKGVYPDVFLTVRSAYGGMVVGEVKVVEAFKMIDEEEGKEVNLDYYLFDET